MSHNQRNMIVLFLLMVRTIFSQDNRIHCNPDNRPQYIDCFSGNVIFTPTCAYYTENCPFEVCGRHVSNPCEACSYTDVLYFTQQRCRLEIVVSDCTEDICHPNFDPQEAIVFEPICGFRRDCTGGGCSRTFLNVCNACANKNYPWYQSGVCENEKKICGQRTKCLRPLSTTAVCAFFDVEDGDRNRYTTVRNARTACLDSAVNFYIKGECKGPNRDNKTYCLPNYRQKVCTREYNPVCGFYKTKDRGLQHKILTNPCIACSNPSIIYHQPGPCIFKCNRNPFIVFECDGVTVNPICGSYQENGETKQVSLKNNCIGCYNVPIKIDSYTESLCPGDEGIRCENDAGGYLIGRIFPVCGLFEKGCNRSSCRQTFAESVIACSNENVILFVPGLCPGDDGVPCDLYRPRLTSEQSGKLRAYLVYDNVCGYHEAGCNNDSCRKSFSNQYDACSDQSVKFFNAGPCSQEAQTQEL